MNKFAFVIKEAFLEKLQAQGVTPQEFEAMLSNLDDPATAVKIAATTKDVFDMAGDIGGLGFKGLAGLGALGGVMTSRAQDDVKKIHSDLEKRQRQLALIRELSSRID